MHVRRSYKNWLGVVSILAVTVSPSWAGRPSRNPAPAIPEEIKAVDAPGGLRYAIQVAKFEDEARWAPNTGDWDLTTAWSEMLTARLVADGRFTVIAERDMRATAREEENFSESDWAKQGSKKAPKKGNMTSAQLLVKGTIVSAKDNTGGGAASFTAGKIPISLARNQAAIFMIVQVVDAQSATVVASAEVTGKSSDTGINLQNLLPGGGGFSMYKSSMMTKACANALGKAVDVIAASLDKVQWTGRIQRIADGELTINRGEREGLKVGSIFAYGTATPLDDVDTGEFLGFDTKDLGRIKVISVQQKFAKAEVVSGKPPTDDMMIWLPKDLDN
jgi:curli biogenesis system outer membrane secretion channel CsgG